MLYRLLLALVFALPITIHAQQAEPLESVRAESVLSPLEYTLDGVVEAINQMPGNALSGAQFIATFMIGMIALAGIIVRNSILLVDFINHEVARGIDFQEAVIQAASVRAKPIVLTGLAAILGALFILDDPIFNGLAIALISGILVSTLLTLVVIPVMFYAFNYRRLESEYLS